MDLINKISEAIWELEAMNCKRNDMIIAYSPLVERFLIKEIYEQRLLYINAASFEKIDGVKTYNLHPYNEIVVYDQQRAYYNPQLLKKIEVSITNRRPDKINQE